jgi:uncharacterized protein YndB with AHSA1/START domain
MAGSKCWSTHDVASNDDENGAREMKSESASNEAFSVAHHWVRKPARDTRRRWSRSGSYAGRYRTLRLTRRFDARPQRVFDAWLDPPFAARWLFATASRPIAHVEIDARIGGGFRFVDRDDGNALEYTGEYTEIVPHRRLAFTLVMPCAESTVTRVLVAIGSLNRGSRLNLIHENVPSMTARYINHRWTGILYGLDVTLASTTTIASTSDRSRSR